MPVVTRIPDRLLDFYAAARLATLCTIRPEGSPHAVPVRATHRAGDGTFRVLTRSGTAKLRNLADHPYAALTEYGTGAWATVEGPVTVTDDRAELALAGRLYQSRFGEEPYPADTVLILRPARILTGQ